MAEIHQNQSVGIENPLLVFVTKLQDADSSEETADLLVKAISPFGYTKFAYARSPVEDAGVADYIGLRNLDADWMEYYIGNELYKDDPLIPHCITSTVPFRWVDLDEYIESGSFTPEQSRVVMIAREWGVSNGVTIPLPCFGRYHAGISLVADPNADHNAQDKVFRENEKTITAIVQAFHAAVNMGIVARDYFGRTKREVEVLKLQSEGLKTKEIAARLETSPHTVEKQAKSARERLFATSSTQAVAKAVLLGIID